MHILFLYTTLYLINIICHQLSLHLLHAKVSAIKSPIIAELKKNSCKLPVKNDTKQNKPKISLIIIKNLKLIAFSVEKLILGSISMQNKGTTGKNSKQNKSVI